MELIAVQATACRACGAALSPSMLACPACAGLVHAETLKAKAGEADAAWASGQAARALELWRDMLALLPENAGQHAALKARMDAVSRGIDAGTLAAGPRHVGGRTAGRWGALGAVGAAAVFLLTKGKLLLMGLLKASTMLSMLASIGGYWTLWGWKFALGLVISIYVHEMGHVAALRRFGIRATAPMFLPGIGAVVRLKQHPASPREDARIGLAGPMWGMGAALAAWLGSLAGGWPSWAATAHVGAWINLLNLLPFWQLDGSRGIRALSRVQRLIVAAFFAAAWGLTNDGILLLLVLGTLFRLLQKPESGAGDWRTVAEFGMLTAGLTALLWVAAAPAFT